MLFLAAAPLLMASVLPVANQTAPVSFPRVGSENDVSIGDPMLTQGTMTTVQGVEISEPFKVAGVSFTSGFYRETGEDEKYLRLHATEKPVAKSYGAVLPKMIIGMDMAADGLDFKVSKDGQKVCIGGNCAAISYKISTRYEVATDSFQQTLLYNGGSGNSIKIGYREFKDDIARSAFSNEIEYDISKSKIIGYKHAKIKIIEADNTHIKYKIIANFN